MQQIGKWVQLSERKEKEYKERISEMKLSEKFKKNLQKIYKK